MCVSLAPWMTRYATSMSFAVLNVHVNELSYVLVECSGDTCNTFGSLWCGKPIDEGHLVI